jgi:putative transposase
MTAFVGALANLGHRLSNQTEGNILRGHGIAPAPKRSQTISWKDFISAHMNVLAGADFFTVEMLSWRGLVTYYVLFFILLVNRRVSVAGIFSSACCASSEKFSLSFGAPGSMCKNAPLVLR